MVLRIVLIATIGMTVLVGCDSGGSSDDPEGAPESEQEDASSDPVAGDGDCPEVSGARQVEIDGAQATEFCGPATATITIGDETLEYDGGRCDFQEDSGFFDLQIGAVVTDIDRAQEVTESEGVRYFAVQVGPSPIDTEGEQEPVNGDGTYEPLLIQAQVGADLFAADAPESTVTLTDGVTQGTFEGTGSLIGGESNSFSGSFACNT